MPTQSSNLIIGATPAITFSAPNQTWIIEPVLVMSEQSDGVVSSQSGSVLINNGSISSGNITGVYFEGANGIITNNAGAHIIGRTDGVNVEGSNPIVNNHGSILGLIWHGISLGGAPGNDVVNNDGDIFGRYAGVWVYSQESATIHNSGTIRGYYCGVGTGSADNIVTEIYNKAGGLIKGGEVALTTSNGRIFLNNQGAVNGDIDCNATNGNVNDSVVNKGDINGQVFLGLGNDVFRNGGAGESGQVFGEEGNDKLFGGNDRDVLRGGSDVDLLRGGRNKDLLFGGDDRDLFDFNSIKDSVRGSKRDKILDFQHGTNATGDDIDLRTIDAKTGVGGNQAFKFIGKQGFHDVKGELRYIDKGASCIVQGDVNGDGKADFEIFVAVGSLAKGDFLL